MVSPSPEGRRTTSPAIPMTPYTEANDDDGGLSEQAALSAVPPAEEPKGSSKSEYLETDHFRRLSLSPALSGRLSPIPHGTYKPIHDVTSPQASTSRLAQFWIRNKPAILVALSQLFGSVMNLSARLLELEGDGMHPMQVLLVRQSLTSVCCFAYMWWMQTPDFPLGSPELRWLLVIRGLSGFAGVFGMWYSMMYLPLADATVITFLGPGVAGFLCYLLLRQPFTRAEQCATVVALLGVVLIAKPTALFSDPPSDGASPGNVHDGGNDTLPGLDHESTPAERLAAVGMALIGVLGAAGAFTTLRAIGKRAHPLISVNYLAMMSTIIGVSVLAMAPLLDFGQPSLRWVSPNSLKQWLLFLSLGVVGFIMQYLLTAGLSADRSNKANAMVYTHMIFAAGFDRWVFGNHMSLTSLAGCTLILGSAAGVMLLKRPPPGQPTPRDDLERQGDFTDEAEDPTMLSAGGNTELLAPENRRQNH